MGDEDKYNQMQNNVWRGPTWHIIGKPVDKTDNFTFLGSNVPKVEEGVKRRTRLAAWAFGRLKGTIWSNQNISRSLDVRINQALILPIATYGAESWTLNKSDLLMLEAFDMNEESQVYSWNKSVRQNKECGDQTQAEYY